MKKSAFVANMVIWVVVCLACGGFLAWYRTVGMDEAIKAIEASPVLKVGVVYAAPLLLFGLGTIAGVLVAWVKKVELVRWARVMLRVIGGVFLALLVLPLIAQAVPALAQLATWPLAIVVFVSLSMPPIIALIGFAYGMGFAGIDASKPRLMEKYLPGEEGRQGYDPNADTGAGASDAK